MARSTRILHTLSRVLTRLFLAAVRVLGLITAVKQLLIAQHPDSVELVFSGFLLAGAQLSEGLILGVIDRLTTGQHGQDGSGESESSRHSASGRQEP